MLVAVNPIGHTKVCRMTLIIVTDGAKITKLPGCVTKMNIFSVKGQRQTMIF